MSDRGPRRPGARPPALARLLLTLLPRPHRGYVAGDLDEEFQDSVLPERGPLRAHLWYWGQVLGSLWAFLGRPPGSGPRGAALAPSRRTRPPLLRELRHAARGLRRRPGFTLVAVLTLAVGIGATSSVFSIADAVLLRPVPGIVDQEALVTVRMRNDQDGSGSGFSLPNLRDLADGAPATSLAAYARMRLQVAGDGLPARTAWAQLVTGDYFGLLGVRAQRGRLFSGAEADAPDGPAVAVVSDAFWRGALGADPGVVGRTLRVNGTPFTVVGVTSPAFRGVERMDSLDLWVPGSAYGALRHAESVLDWRIDNRAIPFFSEALARLAPGRTPAELERRLRTTWTGLMAAYPDENRAFRGMVPAVRADFGLDDQDRASLGATLRILGGLVALILLVTCANVANLLVLRGLRRRGETALRRALGAARAHLLWMHVAESLLLALPAAVLGLAVALLVNAALQGVGLFPEGVARHVSVDGRVFLFAVAVATMTALAFGLVPSLLGRGEDPDAALRGGSRASGRAATLVQGGLSVVQLALSLALVGGALLLGRSVRNLTAVEVGFTADHVLAFDFDPGPQGYDRKATVAFQRDLLDGVRRLPGVEAATVSGFPPFGGITMGMDVRPPDDASKPMFVRADWVGEDFFGVLGIPRVAGRDLRRDDAPADPDASPGRPTATVLNRTMATRLFGTPDRAVGRTLEATVFQDTLSLVVVGVFEDVVDGNLRKAPNPKLYVPLPGAYQSFATLLVRSRRPPEAVSAEVRDALAGLDPNVPLTGAGDMAGRVARATARERAFVRLAALLAAVAILLAGVGLYTVVAWATAQRRREFGIRLAVGASRIGVMRLVFRHALAFGGVGVVVGLGIAVAGSRFLGSLLFGVAPADPATLAVAAALLLGVALAASLTPALHATRVDPAETLRSE